MTANRKTGFNEATHAGNPEPMTADTQANEQHDATGSRLGEVKYKAAKAVTGAKDAIVSGAGTAAGNLRDIAVDKADDARESLSDVGARLAATLERTASEDMGAQTSLKSQVLTTVADGLNRASEGLRQRSVAEMAEDVKMLAKRHPGAFMAAAAVAGFALARFVRSSARRQMAIDALDAMRGPRS
jgi:acetyl-CoA carboxylase beta subunit